MDLLEGSTRAEPEKPELVLSPTQTGTQRRPLR
jgi:hypothetical protein